MFIKKIFDNQADESVHKQFVRFGKGIFENRAVVNARKNSIIKIGTSFEYTNDLVLFCSSLAKELSVSGIIFSREDISSIIDEEGRKKAGLFSYEIAKKLDNEKIKEIAAKAYAMLLDCEAEGISLKIKKKLPKPGKGGKAKQDEKFCILQLDKKFWASIKEEFFFDIENFKKANIKHGFLIEEIIMPEGEKDFEKIRLMAKRKGKIIRHILVDGKSLEKEKSFEA